MGTIEQIIRDNLAQVLENITSAAQRSDRTQDSVKLVAVSKGQPVERILAAVEAGVLILGENYPEETAAKIQQMTIHPQIEWHMIGHLQRRKAVLVAQNFQMIHSVDSLRLAEKLNREMAFVDRKMPILLEMNVSGEETKGGWSALNTSGWSALAEEITSLKDYANLEVMGLMTMPPFSEDLESVRPYFQKLRAMRDYLKKTIPLFKFDDLSMGTSSDYEVAIEEGATFVRVGQAIFGPRPVK